jgi:hypothetical protein
LTDQKATRTTKYGVAHSYERRVPRDRSEWIGIKIPAIIPKELFDRVQARIDYNRNSYRNAKRKQLLSQLVECGMRVALLLLPAILHEESHGRVDSRPSQSRLQVQLASLT